MLSSGKTSAERIERAHKRFDEIDRKHRETEVALKVNAMVEPSPPNDDNWPNVHEFDKLDGINDVDMIDIDAKKRQYYTVLPQRPFKKCADAEGNCRHEDRGPIRSFAGDRSRLNERLYRFRSHVKQVTSIGDDKSAKKISAQQRLALKIIEDDIMDSDSATGERGKSFEASRVGSSVQLRSQQSGNQPIQQPLQPAIPQMLKQSAKQPLRTSLQSRLLMHKKVQQPLQQSSEQPLLQQPIQPLLQRLQQPLQQPRPSVHQPAEPIKPSIQNRLKIKHILFDDKMEV